MCRLTKSDIFISTLLFILFVIMPMSIMADNNERVSQPNYEYHLISETYPSSFNIELKRYGNNDYNAVIETFEAIRLHSGKMNYVVMMRREKK